MNADLVEWQPVDEVFEDEDFTGADLSSAVLTGCQFLRCQFSKVRLFGASFGDCRLTGSRFEGQSLLRPLTVEGGDWSYVALRQANLAGVSFEGVRLRECDFDGANLSRVSFRGCDLSHARFHGADLSGADLRETKLDGVDLRASESTLGAQIDLAGAAHFARGVGFIVG